MQALSGVPGHSLLWATPWFREDLPAEGLLSGDGEEVQVDLAVIVTLPLTRGRHQIYLISFLKVWIYLFYTHECFVCMYVCETRVCFKCIGAKKALGSLGARVTGGCEPLAWMLETEHGSSARAAMLLAADSPLKPSKSIPILSLLFYCCHESGFY